jgi:uncharacterized protein YndB with AHSA1/START domain
MTMFQPDPDSVAWRVHFSSNREAVYRALASDEGRAASWAESAAESDGQIEFRFPNGARLTSRILERSHPERFVMTYFGGTTVSFELADDSHGGTDLLVRETGFAGADRAENLAGWVSVLLALKAAVDHGIDLRNHDPARTWDQGYVDN